MSLLASSGRSFLYSLGVLAVFTLACRGSQPASGGSAPGSRIIQVDGSSTVYPITEAVAEEFRRQSPDVRITVGASGTGGGFQKFCRGETDISDASRPIKPAEIETCQQAGIAFIELPIAYDGLAVVVHPKNSWASSITVAELKRIWEPEAQGKVRRWSQIRPGWPDREIHLFGAGVDSGTYDYFTEAIVGKEGASRGDFTSSENDNVLVQGIASDELALGFFGFAYYDQNKSKLKLLAVDDGNDNNGKGPILPSVETVKNGTYQPLSRPIFTYVSQNAAERPEVRSFIEFFLTMGPKLVDEGGYVSLGDPSYELARQRFASRKTGTMFGEGGSQVGITMEDLLAREK
jgi:phosphate transport system substrate-binding protein